MFRFEISARVDQRAQARQIADLTRRFARLLRRGGNRNHESQRRTSRAKHVNTHGGEDVDHHPGVF